MHLSGGASMGSINAGILIPTGIHEHGSEELFNRGSEWVDESHLIV